MPVDLVKHVIEFQPVTGLPEDVVTNTFHQAGATTLTAEEIEDFQFAIINFYASAPEGGGLPLDNFFSSEMSRVNHPVISSYRYDFSAPQEDRNGRQYFLTGSPIATKVYPGMGAAASAGAAPGQVSLCISYHADLAGLHESIPGGAPGPVGDTRPKARRRGRIYLPPLNQSAVAAGSSPARPSAGLLGTAASVASRLKNTADSIQAGGGWAVFSPTSGTWTLVDGGWVDNRFDTQRRRLVDATARSLWA